MGLLDEYLKTTKALEVEEPVDLWLHRPLGYLIAKGTFSTPITPNQITVGSIILALAGGALFIINFPFHLWAGFGCLFVSAGLDCADGMLARMRKSTSAIGRMLDGAADAASMLGAVGGTVYYMVFVMYRQPWWVAAIVFVLAVLTIYTSTFHTSAYDYYKNIYMRSAKGAEEGEDLEVAEAREEQLKKDGAHISFRLASKLYVAYLRGQESFFRWFDPAVPLRVSQIVFDDERAAIFRKHNTAPMTLLRRYYGVGTLLFCLGLSMGLGRPDIYLAIRLVLMNAVFWLWFRPMQRRASENTRREIAELIAKREAKTS
jgi:phosphatidylglycerophosphate synthase